MLHEVEDWKRLGMALFAKIEEFRGLQKDKSVLLIQNVLGSSSLTRTLR
jgi:hypothetical protein